MTKATAQKKLKPATPRAAAAAGAKAKPKAKAKPALKGKATTKVKAAAAPKATAAARKATVKATARKATPAKAAAKKSTKPAATRAKPASAKATKAATKAKRPAAVPATKAAASRPAPKPTAKKAAPAPKTKKPTAAAVAKAKPAAGKPAPAGAKAAAPAPKKAATTTPRAKPAADAMATAAPAAMPVMSQTTQADVAPEVTPPTPPKLKLVGANMSTSTAAPTGEMGAAPEIVAQVAAKQKKAAPTATESRKVKSSSGVRVNGVPPMATASNESESVKAASKPAAQKSVPVPASAAKPELVVDEEDRPKIAPAPMRPALRVAKRAEARRDKNQTFTVNSQIIYPAHGVGHISDIEKQQIGDIEVELFVINFEHEKMKLRVPIGKAAGSGMRNLSTEEQMADALRLIEGKARIKRTMWSRRAQEYEAKINSGDLVSVAEVVRDLYRADDQPEQSYSERQLFEQARERFGRELAAVRGGTLEQAIAEIHVHLARKDRPGKAA